MSVWWILNEVLTDVVARIPAKRLESPCTVGQNATVSLLGLIVDYLDHLEHHMRQLREIAARD